MKTLLIPTTFQNDTLEAVKSGIHYANGEACTMVVMQVSEVQDTFSASSLLRDLDTTWTDAQEAVLDECRALVAAHANCKLKVHHQFGVSSPLIKNLLDFHAIELIILPQSFNNSSLKIHQYCSQVLANYKTPILHVSSTTEDVQFANAIYLEHEKSNFPLANVQQLVQKQFSLKIVSQAKISSEETSEQLIPIVSEAIAKNDIDIIIETRKAEKIRRNKSKKQTVEDVLGLPVLSIYEEAYS